MLPACNKGAGMSQGFPDVCLTPAPPGPPVPIPYPNIAMHAMAAPFSPSVFIMMMPAINMGSMIPMTSGMEPGVANPLYMQMGMFTTGSPLIMINALPGIMLTAPTTGNMMNNPIGMVQLSAVTNVFFSLAGATDSTLDAEDLTALQVAVGPSSDAAPAVEDASMQTGGVGYVAVRRFSTTVASTVHHAIVALVSAGMDALILDLRGNPGGDAAAAVELASDFLEPGSVITVMTDGDGDETVYRARTLCPHRFPLAILVDGGTASAAEIFASSLQAHGRAVVVGDRTYGKGVARTVVPSPQGARYDTVASFSRPDGRHLEGGGICPDLSWAEVATGRCDALPAAMLAALSEVRV
jgi:carboxyl-terminal processing protease